MNTKLSLLIGILLLQTTTASHAIPTTINANDYLVGTDISSAIDGVTIQNVYHADGAASVVSSAAVVGSTGTACHSCTRNEFNYSYSIPASNDLQSTVLHTLDDPIPSSNEFIGLSVSSDQSFQHFGYTAFSEHGDGLIGLMYGSGDEYLGWFYSNISPEPNNTFCDPGTYPLCFDYEFSTDFSDDFIYYTGFGSLGVDSLNGQVHQIVLASYGAGIYFDSITVEVPEPSTLLLLSLGLLTTGFWNRKPNQ